jgi:EmrB/QacA subfamily drug resistance transporter
MAASTAERGRKLTLAATVLGSSLGFIDATVTTVALPTIEEDLGLGLSGLQWVFLAYTLALAALLLPSGAIGDRRGRRETFIAGIVGFGVASIVCGAAPNGEVLIAGRAAQGVAAALMTTNSLALLREVYGADSGRAIGLWTAGTSLATVAGPPAGGALVEWVSWRWIFFINIPLALAAIVLALAGRCPQQIRQNVGQLDVPGSALTATGFGFLTYALVQGGESGFGRVWWAFLVGAVALAALVPVERRAKEPLVPAEFLRRRNLALANLETFLAYAALGGVLFYLPIYVQFLGFTPFEAGLVTIPVSVALILLAARAGALADRHGPRVFLTAGPALMGIGMLLFLLLDEQSDFWTVGLAGLVVFSLGLAALVAPITATALGSAPEELAGVASGVNMMVSRVGGLLAVALMGFVIARVFEGAVDAATAVPFARGQDDPGLRDGSIDAWRAAILVAAALSFAAAAVALGISNVQARRDARPEEAAVAAGA